jgi:hypothetical protein
MRTHHTGEKSTNAILMRQTIKRYPTYGKVY